MIEIKIINRAHKQDINIKNEPFDLWGYMRPSFVNGEWSYTVQKLPAEVVGEQCFPDENYDYEEMAENSIFVGAYDDGRCIGLAIYQEGFFKHMYLYDLKVNRSYRKQGVAAALIEKGKEIAKQKGYCGLYTQGQDNNLSACLFYIRTGFHIGGFNTDVYKWTKQEGKSDIWFYLDI